MLTKFWRNSSQQKVADHILANALSHQNWSPKIGPVGFLAEVFAKIDPRDYFCCPEKSVGPAGRDQLWHGPLCQFWSPVKNISKLLKVCMLASCNTILPVTSVFNTNEASWRSSLDDRIAGIAACQPTCH